MLLDRTTRLYVLGVFAASWICQFAGILSTHGDFSSPVMNAWLTAAMMTPALGVLVLMLVSKASRPRVLWRLTRRSFVYAPLAIGIPTLVALAQIAVFIVLGWGHSRWFEFSTAGVHVLRGRWLLGLGIQSWLRFALNLGGTATLYSLVGMVLGFGEELGWRGYLQGRLIERFGLAPGVVVLGLLWSAWHLPVLLAGFNYPENRIVGAFVLSPLLLVGASFFMAWLTLRTGSFWPAALVHGAGDSIQAGLTASIQTARPALVGYTLEAVVIALVGLTFYLALRRPGADVTPNLAPARAPV
jgi:membrane protease YdiL (CAAX protease family)